jgi:flagellar basal-body rod protein FlgB
MDIPEPTINTMMKAHMKYMSERQGVLAQNIANMDTPAYKAQDLKKLDFKRLAEEQHNRLEMVATSPAHLGGTLTGGTSFTTIKDKDTFEIRPNQNNVVMEDQMGKVSDTNAEFELSSTMMKKFTSLYREASGNK